MTYVLRKSYGAWSAGTAVSFDEETGGCYIPDGADVPIDLIVQRRNMTMEVPLVNSRERRRRKKALNELTRVSEELPGGYR